MLLLVLVRGALLHGNKHHVVVTLETHRQSEF